MSFVRRPPKTQGHKPVSPVSPGQFRRGLAIYLAIQAAALLATWAIYIWITRHSRTEFEYSLLAIWIITFEFYLSSKHVVNKAVVGRLSDIHPDLPRNRRFLYQVLLIFPVTALPFVAYLSFARRGKPTWFSILIKRPTLLAVGAIALALAPSIVMMVTLLMETWIPGMRAVSYWSSSPTGYYVSALIDEVHTMKEIGAQLESSGSSESLEWRMGQFSRDRYPTITGVVLMMAYESGYHKKKIPVNRKLANDDRARVVLDILDGLKGIIDLAEHSDPVAPNFNLISLLSPTGVTEVALLGAFDIASKRAVKKEEIKGLQGLLNSVETSTKNPHLLSRLKIVRKGLESTQLFRDQSNTPRLPAGNKAF